MPSSARQRTSSSTTKSSSTAIPVVVTPPTSSCESLLLKTTTTNTAEQSTNMILDIIQNQWKGRKEFAWAQLQVIVVLGISFIGNNWPASYPRNDNHNMTMFWTMNGILLIVALATMKHEPPKSRTTKASQHGEPTQSQAPPPPPVQLLSRAQTEEWKGWMQWAFIMYHYYRAYSVYNEIRVFVSAYVWMTGFGNFLYFSKKQDFSVERAISMWLRINYFPILLSIANSVPFDLFYIVPLHTTAFFITMVTCYVASKLLDSSWSQDRRNAAAIGLCFAAHVVFYETPLVNFLKIFSDEIHFRFQADKYSAILGILSGYFWSKFTAFMQWCYNSPTQTSEQLMAAWAQRIGGVGLIALWWVLFGHIDKFTYNPIHPYIFWMPIAGWLMLRNSSKYLTELHSTALEFFGRITLETYVLQFHVFMCRNVQHIPVVIPGSGPDGPWLLKTLNMLLTGILFVGLAYWARKITVTTQTTFTDLVAQVLQHLRKKPDVVDQELETVALAADDGLAKKETSAPTSGASDKV